MKKMLHVGDHAITEKHINEKADKNSDDNQQQHTVQRKAVVSIHGDSIVKDGSYLMIVLVFFRSHHKLYEISRYSNEREKS